GRQIAVPVVKAHTDAADERQVTRAGGVGHHRHGGDRREADDAIGSVLLDGVNVRGCDDFIYLVPVGPHESAESAARLVGFELVGVLNDRAPGFYGFARLTRLTPQADQRAAHQRILQTIGAVQVPGIARAALTTARFMIGQIVARTRIVGLLRFPRDNAALHVDLPRARTSAVHAMRGSYDLVVLPALAVGVFPSAVLPRRHAMSVRELLVAPGKEHQTIEKMTHGDSSMLNTASARSCARSTTR